MSRPSIPVWIELLCADCCQPSPGQFLRKADLFGQAKRDLVSVARGEGWVFKHNEAFCCAEHAANYERRQKSLERSRGNEQEGTRRV
jgi:hypothetical protein